MEALFQTTLVGYTRDSDEAKQRAQTSSRESNPPDRTGTALRASTELFIPAHLHQHIDFIGGINTPIHTYKIKPVPTPQQQQQKQAATVPTTGECAIAAAYHDYIPASSVEELTQQQNPSKYTQRPNFSSLFIPRVVELKSGNEQAYVRWRMKCDAVEATDKHPPSTETALDTQCASNINAFHIVLEPMMRRDDDGKKKKKTDPQEIKHLLASSVPYQLSNCKSIKNEDTTIETECSTIFSTQNYRGYWMKIQAEILPLASATEGRVAPSFLSSCLRGPIHGHEFVSAAFLRSLYSIPPTSDTLHHTNNTLAIVEFMETYWNNKDLQEYLRLMSRGFDVDENGVSSIPPTSRHTHAPSIMGFNNETEALITGDEAQLDVQIVMGLLTSELTEVEDDGDESEVTNKSQATAAGSVSMWNVPGREPENTEEPFLKWVISVQELTSPPLVYSLSYGDIEEQLPRSYIQRLNIEFMKMAIRGMTVVFPAGDKGVASDKEDSDEMACEKAVSEFPVSSPYVLAVGATQLSSFSSTNPLCSRLHNHLSLCSSVSSTSSPPQEVACSAETGGKITTGGGFSDVFARPWYQRQEVDNYLTHHQDALPKAEGFFNREGRGYPDVVAYGTHFVTVNEGEIVPAAGTSASVPVLAAMIALWNDIRLSQNQPPLGLIAPLLYSLHRTHPHAFHDVVEGENRCRLEEQSCCKEGFKAARGWDAVSGLGTPRFDVIAQILQNGYPVSLNSRNFSITNPSQLQPPLNIAAPAVAASIPSASLFQPDETILRYLSTVAVILGGIAVLTIVAGYIYVGCAPFSSPQATQQEQQALLMHF